MPEGLVIIWQLDASSSSPSGSIKVFIDARGGLYNYMAVRCQLLYSPGRFVKVFADARGACNYIAVRCQLLFL
jgi:hypothetical protein